MVEWPKTGNPEEDIEDIVGAMADAGYGLEYDDAEGLIKKTREGPNPYDAAQSFTEGDLTLSGGVAVRSGSIVAAIPDTFEDGDISEYSGATGSYTVQTNTVKNGSNALEGTATNGGSSVIESQTGLGYYPQQGGSWTWYVYIAPGGGGGNGFNLRYGYVNDEDYYTLSAREESSNAQLAESANNSRVNQDDATVNWDSVEGEWVEIQHTWESGGTHTCDILDSQGDSLASLSYTQSNDYSGSGIAFRTYNSTGSDTTVYYDSEEGPKTAIIEWPTPADVYEWDVATYTHSPNGGTADVFVAYSTDGGSTWSRTNGANAISRNYSLADDPNISPEDGVRIEAELSGADTANNPTLDSVYRSWRV
jgi:hypothetical protein